MKKIVLVGVCILSIYCFGLLISCNDEEETRKKLLVAEELITTSPDSALFLLRGINAVQLKNTQDKALYGLLLTMAEDKTYLDPTNDSIITLSVKYFEKVRDIERLIKSNYYLGRVYYHRQEYPKALINFYKSKEYADQESQYFWAGMSCRGLSDTYLKVSASADELKYAELEYENIKKSGIQPYLNYALLDLCRSYHNSRKINETIKTARQLQDSASKYSDSHLYYSATKYIAMNFYWQSNFQESENLFRNLLEYKDENTQEDSLFLMLNLIEQNKNIDRLGFIKMNDTVPIWLWGEYRLNKKNGEIDKAINALEIMNSKLDNLRNQKKSIDLSSSMADYFELNRKLDRIEISEAKYKLGFIISISLLTILALTLILIVLRLKYKNSLSEKLRILEEFELATNLYRKRSKELQNRSKEKLINYSKFNIDILDSLGYVSGIELKESNLSKSQIINYVSKLIRDISKDGKLKILLEEMVDDLFDNVYSDLKTDMPNLTDKDYALFIYSVLGFSNNSIATFLGETNITSVYNRKRRLKNKIHTLQSNNREKYITCLS